MERYVFSGSLTNEMHDRLASLPDFEPLDILVSQLDRSSISKFIQWKHEGFCRWLFIDSGAFSVHTGKANTTTDEYVEYLNSIDDDIDVFAQLDTIPGKFGQPKSKEDYEESARKSWENFLYMRSKVKSPHKLMPVFHFGEDFQVLKDMLEWQDENGDRLDYVGISPANDAPQKEKNIYLQEVTDIIRRSSNPDVKTHLYGMTSLDALAKYKCYSADSISHRLIAAYNKVYSPTFGVVSISDRYRRSSQAKSNMSFAQIADDYNLDILKKELAECNITLEEAKESSAARVVFNMHSIQRMIKTTYAYEETKVKRAKKLF